MPTLRLSLDHHRTEAVSSLLEAVENFLGPLGVPPVVRQHLLLSIEELVANSIQYGKPDEDAAPIHLELAATDEALRCWITDSGVPFDPLTDVPAPDLDSPIEIRRVGGLGVYLVRTLMDEMTYERRDGQNHVMLMKRLKVADPT